MAPWPDIQELRISHILQPDHTLSISGQMVPGLLCPHLNPQNPSLFRHLSHYPFGIFKAQVKLFDALSVLSSRAALTCNGKYVLSPFSSLLSLSFSAYSHSTNSRSGLAQFSRIFMFSQPFLLHFSFLFPVLSHFFFLFPALSHLFFLFPILSHFSFLFPILLQFSFLFPILSHFSFLFLIFSHFSFPCQTCPLFLALPVLYQPLLPYLPFPSPSVLSHLSIP